MSGELQRDYNSYTEHELRFIRIFILILYALVLFSVIAIGALIAIITKNPFCGVYGVLPAALLIPMQKIIDRVFPSLGPAGETKPVISALKKLRSKTKAQSNELSVPGP